MSGAENHQDLTIFNAGLLLLLFHAHALWRHMRGRSGRPLVAFAKGKMVPEGALVFYLLGHCTVYRPRHNALLFFIFSKTSFIIFSRAWDPPMGSKKLFENYFERYSLRQFSKVTM